MLKILFSYLFKTSLSAFRAAILANNTNRICRILNLNRDYIHKELDVQGNTPLLLAMKYASSSTVRLLLEAGASPDQPNFLTFQTPLGLLAVTVYENDRLHEARIALEMANILLDYGAYVDQPSIYKYADEDGHGYVITETPLMIAVRTRNLPIATLFVERKANVNYVEKLFENRPVHFSITNGDEEMFDLLENAGASCRSVVNNEKNTLLHCFCLNKDNDEHISLLEKLIDKGCDVDAENTARRTPLMLAVKLNMINTCRVLINVHANIDKIDYEGFQVIDFTKPDSDCFKLLKQGKDTQKMNSQASHNKHQTYRRKKYISTSPVSKQISEPIKHFRVHDNKIKPCMSNGNYEDKIMKTQKNLSRIESDRKHSTEEIHTKYKNMWERLIETKQQTPRTNDLSLQKADESTRQLKSDLSQARTNDLHKKTECIITIEL
ncbi:unnamed protein product [Rotaria magnacalcarata]|uniref:Uncharacterized protein n=1 Tax=Rotaria magnacalcarata TaxID=392030 RepID=A0A816WGL6_9BILA|nr:unnamed protein product [Rotaria magnacalcarata]CAF1644049.1 unnamed protein product [Rotaria magnacalcarata]CAF2135156.1 unnamed protein product [Rotaria magnacalcarata]CAF3786404.1 unnamed protein product [Rotaria magnacalcarata]CAF3874177.1 unnamed protein product [Rotaria magnacalcarata]